MIKILLYADGNDIHYCNKALAILKKMYEEIPVIAIGWMGDKGCNIQDLVYSYEKRGLPWLDVKNIQQIEYDFIIVTGGYKVNFASISSKLQQFGVSDKKIVLV